MTILYIGRCYYFLRIKQPWTDNARACVAVDMLPMRVTDEKLEFIVNKMMTDDGKIITQIIYKKY